MLRTKLASSSVLSEDDQSLLLGNIIVYMVVRRKKFVNFLPKSEQLIANIAKDINDKYLANVYSTLKSHWYTDLGTVKNLVGRTLPEGEGGSTETKSSGGCYVATCVYGSYDCPQVWTLRRFRDNTIANNAFGKLFIKLYYAISPHAVNLFGDTEWFHKLFKVPLDKFVKKLQEKGVENTPYED